MINLKGVEISTCDENFLIQIYDILKQENSGSRDLARDLAEIFASDVISFVAHRKKRLLGFIIALRLDCDIHIKSLYVLPKYRGLGIASELFETLEKNVKNFGDGNFFIDIHTRYGDLVKFFNKRGFVLEEQRVVLKKFFNGEIY
ncbi:MAG TPA: GNAT family N-acetyltransferase [Spirochaetota bacterium]|nr:GNAT family N-acetyltransferase [Spirochaetota bacterium]